jgi:hypothetical protein
MGVKKIDAIKALNDMSAEEWRFWGQVDTSGTCWNWRGGKTPTGYGVFKLHGKAVRAHRAVWLFTHGELLSEEIIRHKCNNPSCVNPSHLLAGTHADNSADKVKDGRASGGGKPTIGMAGAESIRLEYERGGVTQQQLAQKYGIALRSVHNIIGGHVYKK